MNTTGLNIIKTLGCLTAVTFFTVYNTYDNYNYNYDAILAFLTFISTIATPLFFVVTGYMDADSQHTPEWQMKKIRGILTIFIFWFSIYYLWGPYQKGYLIQPWFIFSLVIIYTFHPVVEWLAKRRVILASLVVALLVFSFAYDLLAIYFTESKIFSAPAQFRIWTWVLYYLTGQLLYDPVVSSLYSRPRIAKYAAIAIPFVYTFTWFYEKRFFFSLFNVERNSFILTGSQVYILVLLIIIAANGVKPEAIRLPVSEMVSSLGKTMTGVYILHYTFFNLLIEWIPIHSLTAKLLVILMTFLLSVLSSMLLLKSNLTKKLITF
ncbi:acyltransferase family protein [Rahnella sikkimica]|uniref:Acyltransferase n=1 Tax=Rahnella sikkimica TaxID=1805933 RepID=A0A2L1US57_9GAMM|nr:acyltransferase family protein [Rahnella sikkimica]AVF35770.1 acyltransferase [Rahnella sikkimica]